MGWVCQGEEPASNRTVPLDADLDRYHFPASCILSISIRLVTYIQWREHEKLIKWLIAPIFFRRKVLKLEPLEFQKWVPQFPSPGVSKVPRGGLDQGILPGGTFTFNFGLNEWRPNFHEGIFAATIFGTRLCRVFRDLGTNCTGGSKIYQKVLWI